jgi:hypothetical protein
MSFACGAHRTLISKLSAAAARGATSAAADEGGAVHLELTDEQAFFCDTTRTCLAAEAPLGVVRELDEAPDGFERRW